MNSALGIFRPTNSAYRGVNELSGRQISEIALIPFEQRSHSIIPRMHCNGVEHRNEEMDAESSSFSFSRIKKISEQPSDILPDASE